MMILKLVSENKFIVVCLHTLNVLTNTFLFFYRHPYLSFEKNNKIRKKKDFFFLNQYILIIK